MTLISTNTLIQSIFNHSINQSNLFSCRRFLSGSHLNSSREYSHLRSRGASGGGDVDGSDGWADAAALSSIECDGALCQQSRCHRVDGVILPWQEKNHVSSLSMKTDGRSVAALSECPLPKQDLTLFQKSEVLMPCVPASRVIAFSTGVGLAYSALRPNASSPPLLSVAPPHRAAPALSHLQDLHSLSLYGTRGCSPLRRSLIAAVLP